MITLEKTNATWGDRSEAIMAWDETPTGRVRLWCLPCRENGADWLTPEPCEHIQQAEPQQQIPHNVALNTLRSLIIESPITLPSGENQP